MTEQAIIAGLSLSALAGAATPIGGLVAVAATKRARAGIWSFGLGVSAGMMVFLSVFDLLPEAFEFTAASNGRIWVPAFFVLGLAVTWMIDLLTHRWVEHCTPTEGNGDNPGGYPCATNQIRHSEETSSLAHAGLVAAMAIALHNIPEGIATFATASSDYALGLSVAVAVAIHNVPEGFCVALPIYCATGNAKRALSFALVAGLAEPFGGLITLLFLGPFITQHLLGCLFAIVAGIMVYAAVDELIPAGSRMGRSHLHLTGFVVGMLLMWAGMNLIK